MDSIPFAKVQLFWHQLKHDDFPAFECWNLLEVLVGDPSPGAISLSGRFKESMNSKSTAVWGLATSTTEEWNDGECIFYNVFHVFRGNLQSSGLHATCNCRNCVAVAWEFQPTSSPSKHQNSTPWVIECAMWSVIDLFHRCICTLRMWFWRPSGYPYPPKTQKLS